jgi:hypothetical protein
MSRKRNSPVTETARDRRDLRTLRRAKLQKEQEEAEQREQLHETLGEALAAALLRYLADKPASERTSLERAMAMTGYSDELKRLIARSVETCPALEESFLLIAELAYRDGEEAREPDWDNYY